MDGHGKKVVIKKFMHGGDAMKCEKEKCDHEGMHCCMMKCCDGAMDGDEMKECKEKGAACCGQDSMLKK